MEVHDAGGHPGLLAVAGSPPLGLLWGVASASAQCPDGVGGGFQDCAAAVDIVRIAAPSAADAYGWAGDGGLFGVLFDDAMPPEVGAGPIHAVPSDSVALSAGATIAWQERSTRQIRITPFGGNPSIPSDIIDGSTETLPGQLTFADETLFWVCGNIYTPLDCGPQGPGVFCAERTVADPPQYEDAITYLATSADSIWVVPGPDTATNTDDFLYLGLNDGRLVRGPATCGDATGQLEILSDVPGALIGHIVSDGTPTGPIFWTHFAFVAGGVYMRHPDAPVLGTL
jgi:hypothetical protein